MRRRTYLVGSIGVVGSLAGCTGVLDDSDDSESADDPGPAGTIEAFYDAALRGDAETARSFFHPDAETPVPSDQTFESVQQSSLQFEGATVIEEGENEATVEATLSQEMTTGERRERTARYLLRRSDGEWKIYDQPPAGYDGPNAPQVQWDVTERTEGGAVTAVVFEHSGGDTVDSRTLSAYVDGSIVGSPGTASDVEAGTAVVVPMDDDGESVGTGATVELRWKDFADGDPLILATVTLTGDTAGSPAEWLRIE